MKGHVFIKKIDLVVVMMGLVLVLLSIILDYMAQYTHFIIMVLLSYILLTYIREHGAKKE